MQTPKARNCSGAPQKISPRVARKLKASGADNDSASPSSQATRTPKEKSPKLVERRSPRSPASEKKRPSRISDLECQVSQLQDELKKTKDQLASSESWKKQAQQESADAQDQITALSLKLEESQQQILALSSTKETCEDKLSDISQEQKLSWESDLATAKEEIERLKLELKMVVKSEAEQTKSVETTKNELQNLRENLAETLSLLENMKMELKDSKESEDQAKVVVNETLQELETAKATVEALRLEGMKVSEAYTSVVSELEQSKDRVKLLDGLVSKLEADLSQNLHEEKVGKILNSIDADGPEGELISLKAEVEGLKSELENVKRRHNEETVKNIEELKKAQDLMEQMIFNSGTREAELAMELEKARATIEELKANLMDKETELQGIVEENEELSLKLEKNLSNEKESELASELKKLEEEFLDLKASMMDKETELQSVLEENESLKLENEKKGVDAIKSYSELEAVREAEREAVMKVSILMEEVEKSKGRATRVAEQLEAAQASGAKMEAELRRYKVQSDQWRKAAEAAAALLNGTNGKYIDRTGSLDSCYNSGRMGSPYEDVDDDSIKKKNGNVLKKFGVLWKKPQK
ncbi:hypothetical protein SAY86_001713 [Trapa natans]|uniref:Interactor of constitutive active ROPs 3 n=1 Tax=Trapa natans TaxID=22666 RepID=A0AAN7LIM2_TRANT|nr:hypothetical protein SAY86_001713 [Trapa natans]